MKKKIVLTGNFGVGKTAIRKCLLSEAFIPTYTPSFGIYVDKITAPLSLEENVLFIWDLPGEFHQNNIPRAHFMGSDFVLYVVDLTRPSTYLNIHKNLIYLHSILPHIPTIIVGNKKDLISSSQLLFIKNNISYSLDIITSAKTGENINYLFKLPILFPKAIVSRSC